MENARIKFIQITLAAGIVMSAIACHAGRSTGMNNSTPIDSSEIKNSVSAIAPYDSQHLTGNKSVDSLRKHTTKADSTRR